ncbi:rolling circle replication-associated protein [Burkholderia multivorans]|uniref:rolling circle replication-associated protein n=1 Tax=Burkholderia multivorans TaxID=87883 RepID=UPI0011B23FE5|nr:hypothetical protein [Burkholderia multivorans]MDN7473476.1 hypothetical protein [Burkholderia multivorans]
MTRDTTAGLVKKLIVLRQVRGRCKAIAADRMITLTYRENMQDESRLKRDFDALRRQSLKRPSFRGVAVVCRQKRGALHVHMFVKERQSVQVLRSAWRNVVGEDGGNVHILRMKAAVDFLDIESFVGVL